MPNTFALALVLLIGLPTYCISQDKQSKPVELNVLKTSVGIWDAAVEVWPEGLDAASIKFKGVETNRPFGKHWIASDFESEFAGQTSSAHAIVGYDLDRKKLVGTVVDAGPYAAAMTGEYDEQKQTVTWITKVKDPSGKELVQKTLVTQTAPNQRRLVLMVPGDDPDSFQKFMEINFTKRNGNASTVK